MTLGVNIIFYRKQREITQEQLAEIMQVSRQSVSKWENNEAVPELQKLIKLADVLEVGLDELCGREYTPTESQVESTEVATPRKKIVTRILSVILVIFLLLAGTTAGFYVGQSRATDARAKEFYQTTGVSSVDFKLEESTLICEVIPEIYVEEFEYVILVSDGWNPVREVDVVFEKQIGKADIKVNGSFYYNLTLQVKNGEDIRNINLVERLYPNTKTGIVYIHDEK